MKTFLPAFILLLFVVSVKAQPYPLLEWATHTRATISIGSEDGKKLAVDASGNVYTTGTFSDTVDFNPGVGVDTLVSPIYNSGYLLKLDAEGNFSWVTDMGFSNPQAIAIDLSGNIYTAGRLYGEVDMDPGPDTFLLGGGESSFITKYSSAGDFIWAKDIDNVDAVGITIDDFGNVYVSGGFEGNVDFDPGAGTFYMTQPGPNSEYAFFLLKLNNTGDFKWAKKIMADGAGLGDGLTICGLKTDEDGNVYYGGCFQGAGDVDPDAGTLIFTPFGETDNLVGKIDSGGTLLWVKQIGGTDYDFSIQLELDDQNNVFLTGYFMGTADFDPGSGVNTVTSQGSFDGFVLKLTSAGNFAWVKTIGGTGVDGISDVSFDDLGNIYLGGSFEDTADLNPGPGTEVFTATGFESDGFILRLNPSGNFVWARAFGKEGEPTDFDIDFCWSLVVDNMGYIHAMGGFTDTVDFDPGNGVFDLHGGQSETFILKWGQSDLTSVDQPVAGKQLNALYPNPSAGIVNLVAAGELRSASIRMKTISGEIIQQWLNVSGNKVALNVNAHAPGMYFIELTEQDGAVSILRLLKQ